METLQLVLDIIGAVGAFGVCGLLVQRWVERRSERHDELAYLIDWLNGMTHAFAGPDMAARRRPEAKLLPLGLAAYVNSIEFFRQAETLVKSGQLESFAGRVVARHREELAEIIQEINRLPAESRERFHQMYRSLEQRDEDFWIRCADKISDDGLSFTEEALEIAMALRAGAKMSEAEIERRYSASWDRV